GLQQHSHGRNMTFSRRQLEGRHPTRGLLAMDQSVAHALPRSRTRTRLHMSNGVQVGPSGEPVLDHFQAVVLRRLVEGSTPLGVLPAVDVHAVGYEQLCDIRQSPSRRIVKRCPGPRPPEMRVRSRAQQGFYDFVIRIEYNLRAERSVAV